MFRLGGFSRSNQPMIVILAKKFCERNETDQRKLQNINQEQTQEQNKYKYKHKSSTTYGDADIEVERISNKFN